MKGIFLVVVSSDDDDESIVLATHDERAAQAIADRAFGRVEQVPYVEFDDGDGGDE